MVPSLPLVPQLKPIGTESLLLHLVAELWNWRLSMSSGKHVHDFSLNAIVTFGKVRTILS